MKIRNIVLTSAAVLFCTASASAATIAHTWVSGSGNDSNTCTFASPCATFTGALAKTVTGGIITAKDAGDFGAVTIGQSVTIDGSNIGSIGFAGDSEGIYVSSPSATTAINVVIHNLTIDGQGTGSDAIFIANAANVTIDNCKIEGFTQIGIGLGSEGPENVVITNTVIDGANVGNLGVRTFQSSPLATPNDTVALDHVIIKGMTSAAVFSRDGTMQITYSVLTQSAVGVEADTSAVISVANTAITSNTEGVCSYTGSKIRLDMNDIYDNPTAIDDCGGTYKTSGSNRTSGAITATPAEISNSVLF
jgi:hypothetical protein